MHTYRWYVCPSHSLVHASLQNKNKPSGKVTWLWKITILICTANHRIELAMTFIARLPEDILRKYHHFAIVHIGIPCFMLPVNPHSIPIKPSWYHDHHRLVASFPYFSFIRSIFFIVKSLFFMVKSLLFTVKSLLLDGEIPTFHGEIPINPWQTRPRAPARPVPPAENSQAPRDIFRCHDRGQVWSDLRCSAERSSEVWVGIAIYLVRYIYI